MIKITGSIVQEKTTSLFKKKQSIKHIVLCDGGKSGWYVGDMQNIFRMGVIFRILFQQVF